MPIMTRRGMVWVVLLGMWLGGCVEERVKPAALDDSPPGKVQPAVAMSEEGMRQAWIGKKRADLVKAFGHAQSVIGTTIRGRQPTEGYLYDPKKIGGGSCTHAFVVVVDTGLIEDYFCR
ncbi:MAG: hypothetical protein H7836_00145 [Magnetococcus sp. YQC-3]